MIKTNALQQSKNLTAYLIACLQWEPWLSTQNYVVRRETHFLRIILSRPDFQHY